MCLIPPQSLHLGMLEMRHMMQLFSFADLMEKAIDGTLMTDITANYMNVSVLKGISVAFCLRVLERFLSH